MLPVNDDVMERLVTGIILCKRRVKSSKHRPVKTSLKKFPGSMGTWPKCRRCRSLRVIRHATDLSRSLIFMYSSRVTLIVQDPRVARHYFFSDGQNMYNPVVLLCTVNVHMPVSLGRRPILKYKVLQVRKNYTHFTYSLGGWFLCKL